MVEEASRRESMVQAHLEGNATQAGSLFVTRMMQVSDRIVDSNVATLTKVPIDDPQFPLPVLLNELD